ncbi:hypothetical protein IFM89_000963 [Coptis chinensis]|uniref:Uncharacterized protein n=1 Tax=Coptis chinensis TaxID=261450 RepID=A0A835IMJ3_9MAGN|nr:hypothetical protein IFM89_000963 [Coptis chinensis]
MLEELEGMKDSLRLEKEKLAELTCNWEKLKSLIKEKDDALQTASKFQAELRVQKEELTVDEENLKRLENEKFHLEQEIIRIEKKNSDEIGNLERNFEQERGTYKLRVSELEKKLEISRQDLATVESTLSVKNVELDTLHHNLRELEELREMKEDIDRKNEQSASLLKKQGAQLLELEALYKEEQILRKRYFNTIEGCQFFSTSSGYGKFNKFLYKGPLGSCHSGCNNGGNMEEQKPTYLRQRQFLCSQMNNQGEVVGALSKGLTRSRLQQAFTLNVGLSWRTGGHGMGVKTRMG